MQISSTQNPRIKDFVRLQEKAQERREKNCFVVEGHREISRALAKGWQAVQLFWWPGGGISPASLPETDAEKIEVNEAVYRKIAYRESKDGLIAVFQSRALSLDSLKLPENPLLLVLESVEKPGNLGAILRSADGAGVDAILVCDPKTDVYNPNCVRASLGCLFSVPVAVCSGAEAQAFLNEKSIQTFAALPASRQDYFLEDYRGPTAFLLGTEADGLSETLIRSAQKGIRIPMLGIADSLNVSVSAAVLAYEARRQRLAGNTR